jgi:hypothetical protein
MYALRRFSRISTKYKIRNVTIRQQNWIRGNSYKGDRTEPAHMVRPCSKNGRRKTGQDSTEVEAKTKDSTRKTDGIMKAMNEGNLKEGQWKDRKEWSLGVGQRKKVWKPIYIYIYI